MWWTRESRVFYAIGRYLNNTGNCLSQLFNVMVLMSNRPNESVSGRAHREARAGSVKWKRVEVVLDNLFYVIKLESDHCRISYYNDLHQAKTLLKEYEDGTNKA